MRHAAPRTGGHVRDDLGVAAAATVHIDDGQAIGRRGAVVHGVTMRMPVTRRAGDDGQIRRRHRCRRCCRLCLAGAGGRAYHTGYAQKVVVRRARELWGVIGDGKECQRRGVTVIFTGVAGRAPAQAIPPSPTIMRLPLLAAAAASLVCSSTAAAQTAPATELSKLIEAKLPAVMPKVVAWRRDIHEHPELSFEETRTAALVADHLRKLGIEVQAPVGKTGVVGILRGGKPGPVVALRADMDALPVTELVDLPFKSKVRTQWQGQDVGVMHACGHDNHVAILMGAAEVLAGMKPQIPGTIKFLFQPAEEGLGGAKAMVDDGALTNPAPAAVFGLHVWPNDVGQIAIRQGPIMAAAGNFKIIVKGRQTHGSSPWMGVDPIVVSSQIVLGLQTIASRQVNVAYLPSVLTVGQIAGGNRSNIIPDSVVMVGTLRTFDDNMRADIAARITRTAQDIARSGGATALVEIDKGGLVTSNDTSLTDRMLPTFRRAAGGNVAFINPVMGSEDFPVFAQNIPGVFFFLGVTPKGKDPATVPTNHSPLFFADEAALITGVRTMASIAVDYLTLGPVKKSGT